MGFQVHSSRHRAYLSICSQNPFLLCSPQFWVCSFYRLPFRSSSTYASICLSVHSLTTHPNSGIAAACPSSTQRPLETSAGR